MRQRRRQRKGKHGREKGIMPGRGRQKRKKNEKYIRRKNRKRKLRKLGEKKI